jgi:TatD DNase family protein
MFDSHCHLHDARIADPDRLIVRARAAGVRGFLLAGVDAPGWDDEARLAARHPDVAVSLGIHPQRVAELDDAAGDDMLAALAEALERSRASTAPSAQARLEEGAVRACAVGEIGLDAVGERRASLARQERLFRAQLALASRHQLPVALHVLGAGAHTAAIAVLSEAGVPWGGVLHSCSASAELVRDYLALGLSISFAGAISNANARKTHAAARAVPPERLLVETDAPDQTPAPHCPGPNEPAFLAAVVDALARARGENAAALAAYSEANARRLFRLTGGRGDHTLGP